MGFHFDTKISSLLSEVEHGTVLILTPPESQLHKDIRQAFINSSTNIVSEDLTSEELSFCENDPYSDFNLMPESDDSKYYNLMHTQKDSKGRFDTATLRVNGQDLAEDISDQDWFNMAKSDPLIMILDSRSGRLVYHPKPRNAGRAVFRSCR